jgi:nicotinate-nucleotide adenylyltransferase
VTPFGVLGGSFDPVHRGHLVLAAYAREALGLGRVFFMPCAEPPHKPERTLAARHHRLEMLYLAVEGWPGLRVSTYEIARGGRHYTIETLRSLRAITPKEQPVFLVGSDALAEVEAWRGYQELLAEFDFGVAMRPETGGAVAAAWPDAVPPHLWDRPSPSDAPLGAGGRIFRLSVDALAISSSLIRWRLSSGLPLADLVPPRVARYIQRHGVYTEEVRS